MRKNTGFFIRLAVIIIAINSLYSQSPDLKLVDWKPVRSLEVRESGCKFKG
jgi:hypothetical protein